MFDKMLFESNNAEYTSLRYALTTASEDAFYKYSPAYLSTNENLKQVFRHLNVRDKSILTVCAGSGDFLFNAKLFGAAHVDQFDISLFSKYVYEIKYQALQNLTYSEFIRFFYHSGSFLNKKSANKFTHHLSTQGAYLLERAQDSKYCAEWMLRLFNVESTPIQYTYPRKSPYVISQDSYNTVRQTLPTNSKFYPCDLNDLPLSLERQYDIIYLSNICQYIRSLRDFSDIVNECLIPYTKNNGKIVCYQAGGQRSWTAPDLRTQFHPRDSWRISIKAMKSICSDAWIKADDPKKHPDTLFTLEKTR